MHKDILTGVLRNEAKPLFVVEPLHFATCHIFPDLRGEPKAKNGPTELQLRR